MATNITARIRIKNKDFEILVDCDKAISFRKQGIGSVENIIAIPTVFLDLKKGNKAGVKDMEEAFGTSDISKVASHIIKNGELELPIEYRKKMRDEKRRQIIDWLARNCCDPKTGLPHPAIRIENALEQAKVRIDENKSAEDQITGIIHAMQPIIPIRIEVKKFTIKIPAEYTRRVYSIIQGTKKESEKWLEDGSLQIVLELPAGIQLEFFDKLNSVTHGSAVTEEIKK
ncbi:ribosome assembly factor SBDS [Candidatus Pacearchaeota archaeon CG06_land_8_20_14_3_00_35_12]|nr:MAG: ribosome assembly factor SBDS [Candidatus Pacearchaeota archaeon CG06_land_8_20_14_3_00_35_12]